MKFKKGILKKKSSAFSFAGVIIVSISFNLLYKKVILNKKTKRWRFFVKLGFTPYMVEQPLKDTELQKNHGDKDEKHIKKLTVTILKMKCA